MEDISIAYLIAFFGAIFFVWLFKPVAAHIQFIDLPQGRKQHRGAVPLIGGVAVCFAFYAAMLFMPSPMKPDRVIILVGFVMLIVGVVDDVLDLSARSRLLAQLVLSVFLVLVGHVNLVHLGALFGSADLMLGAFSVVLTLLMVMGFVNASNMLDGQDGLAGMVFLGQVLLLATIASLAKQYAMFHTLVLLALALVAFLGFNMRFPWRKRAAIFLGDSGSTFLGVVIIAYAIQLSQRVYMQVPPVTFLWVIAYAAFDSIGVSIARVCRGRSPLSAGRDHFHHILQRNGFSVTQSTLLIASFSWLLGVVGVFLALYRVDQTLQLIALLVLLVVYCMLLHRGRRE